MTNNLYTYEATVLRIVDGDTAELEIDLGFTIYWKSTCRFYGINTPELKSKDKQVRDYAKLAKAATEGKLPIGSKIKINSRELDKYGRPLVDIYIDDLHLNQWLVDNGYAITYLT
jgi:micrococcal nuclease